jgi:exopolyphosphatase / guanosine-5'-triphosphate,3'-diphosphate pyrophosphatase
MPSKFQSSSSSTSVTEAVAAMDCGSNSTRLLIADREGRTLSREMHITRLSQGVDASSTLTAEAMERTFKVLEHYHEACEQHGATRGLLVATSAVRDAHNAPTFLDRAHAIVGFDVKVLSGAEEAEYSYSGATRELVNVATPTMIVDVGGGSSELAVRVKGHLRSFSMQLGCVRVAERALGKGIVTSDGDKAARSMIEGELDRAFSAVPEFRLVIGDVRLVGLAGTVATLAQLDAGIRVYDRDVVHHRVLTRSTVQYRRDLLSHETPEERLRHPGMVVGREDVLPAGLYVLDAVMERFEVDYLLSSESDILDGIVFSLV